MQSTLIQNERAQSKAQPLYPLKNSALMFFGLALLLAASSMTIHFDVIGNQSGIGESSLVEYFQEGYLFVTAMLFASVAIKRPEQRGFAVLASGFFFVVLIRELDAPLDQIVHGFWKYPAWLLAMAAIGYAVSHKTTTIQPLINYTKHRSFGMMLAGMATLLVFTRIFGMGELWQALMQDHYIRAVKNLAEEGMELMAYSLILFAAAWYSLSALFKKTN